MKNGVLPVPPVRNIQQNAIIVLTTRTRQIKYSTVNCRIPRTSLKQGKIRPGCEQALNKSIPGGSAYRLTLACLGPHMVKVLLKAGNEILAGSFQVSASWFQPIPLSFHCVAERLLPRHQGNAVQLRLNPSSGQTNTDQGSGVKNSCRASRMRTDS